MVVDSRLVGLANARLGNSVKQPSEHQQKDKLTHSSRHALEQLRSRLTALASVHEIARRHHAVQHSGQLCAAQVKRRVLRAEEWNG